MARQTCITFFIIIQQNDRDMAQMLWLVIDFNRWTCTITHYLCSLGPLPPSWWLVPCCSVGLGDRMWEGVSLVETMVIPPDRPPEWRFRDLAVHHIACTIVLYIVGVIWFYYI
jgi:hypothetical protein